MSCHSLDPPSYCLLSRRLKVYQVVILSVPAFLTLILLFFFYVFYLRRRANWQSLRMRASDLTLVDHSRLSEIGIKKELREMLPVVVFKESFSVRETECSVCLRDYEADDRLHKMPHCGHSFHVDCIDYWLASNATCPLCRASLYKAVTYSPGFQGEESINDRSLEQPLEMDDELESGLQEREAN
ncbi:hypothetical protein HPP92_018849 [Vanilla planifolia]|uniref:RING-type E3 ubiquitin transferase n=1 Tax=Vanilla planifolia TaxID=51239 RepID=A0A835Q5Q1_VANPL|nr:hypothetical protein HPP92_019417 [Vanilla planifolia]KAG0464685.1 hypothetical protein HPP92_018849 [Vanilla planifolia]